MADDGVAPRDIAALLRGYSIEVTSREPKTIDSCPERLEPGTEVYLTWIPGDDAARTIAAAATLRRAGLIPVPHIGARHIESETQLATVIARLADEAGVDQVLMIAGDRDKPAGPFQSSLQVMDTGVFQRNGITRVGISGFPEGNPKIPEAELAAAMNAKIESGKRNGLTLHIVSQFAFEAEPILTWLRGLRQAGIDLPARIGLAGPASIATLTRYALRCGIGNSVRALTRSPSLTRLLTETSPEPIIRELIVAANADANLGIAGLHFFVFGGFNKTAEWIRSKRG